MTIERERKTEVKVNLQWCARSALNVHKFHLCPFLTLVGGCV